MGTILSHLLMFYLVLHYLLISEGQLSTIIHGTPVLELIELLNDITSDRLSQCLPLLCPMLHGSD